MLCCKKHVHQSACLDWGKEITNHKDGSSKKQDEQEGSGKQKHGGDILSVFLLMCGSKIFVWDSLSGLKRFQAKTYKRKQW